MRLLGAILAGGHSLRFGSDKARALLDGRALIDHVAAALARDCDTLVVCGRAHGALPWVEDRPAPDLGPLGGLCAALAYGQAAGCDAVLCAPCDVPDLPPDLLAHLSQAGGAACLAAIPVIGLWPCSLAARLDRHLAESDDRSLRAWARVAGATPVVLPNPPSNINTPADLAALRSR